MILAGFREATSRNGHEIESKQDSKNEKAKDRVDRKGG